MLNYQDSILIQRPVEEVFAYMQDIGREFEWQPNLREAHQTPEGEPGVGTTRRYVSEFMGRRFENTYIYGTYEPNKKVAYTSAPNSDTQATGVITWQAVGGDTKVTIRVEAEVAGVFRLIPSAMIASVAKKELGDSLLRLKERLEADG